MLVLFGEQRRAWQWGHLGSSCAHKDGTAGAAAAGAGAGEACVGATGRVSLLAKGAAGGRSAVAQLSWVLLVLLRKSTSVSGIEKVIRHICHLTPKQCSRVLRVSPAAHARFWHL